MAGLWSDVGLSHGPSMKGNIHGFGPLRNRNTISLPGRTQQAGRDKNLAWPA